MLYDYPEYYEVAFSFRDIPQETDFLQSCIRRYSRIPVREVLEIACGPALHAEELVSRGYRYTGLDINRNMLDYAAYKWRQLIPRPTFLQKDMVSFTHDSPFDFAFVLLGSLYLNSLEEMHSHFDSVATVLKPGGLYFLDWCIQFSNPLQYNENNAYSIEKDGIVVDSEFKIRLVDAAQHMYEEVWSVNVNDHGRHRKFEMIERNKAVFPDEFLRFLEKRSDFEFVGWWREWDLSKPIEEGNRENVTRPVILIRRVG